MSPANSVIKGSVSIYKKQGEYKCSELVNGWVIWIGIHIYQWFYIYDVPDTRWNYIPS